MNLNLKIKIVYVLLYYKSVCLTQLIENTFIDLLFENKTVFQCEYPVIS